MVNYTADETIVAARRRGGRVAEGGGLLNRYTGQNLYRGFESLPLRQIPQFQKALPGQHVVKPGQSVPIYLVRDASGK